MDRLNITGNNFDISRTGFVKPGGATSVSNENKEPKAPAKASSDASPLGVKSDISAVNTASAESSIRSPEEAKSMVEQSAGIIIDKAENSVLAQANQSPKEVMGLLQSA